MKKSPKELIKKLKKGNLTQDEFRDLVWKMKEAGLTGQIMTIDDPNSPEAKDGVEYIEYHKKLPRSFPKISKKQIEKACQKLLAKESTLEEKKKAIILLAHTGKEKPLEVLKKYGDSSDEELKTWVNMAIDECRSFMASDVLKEPVINVSKVTKVGRNNPCPCGSGEKYKKCCGGLK